MVAAVESASAGVSAPMLELRGINAAYGPFRAIFDVSFAVQPGRVLALLGSNGAGKTTIARVCSGLVVPTSGQVFFAGEEVTGLRAYRYARLGIVHSPLRLSVFPSLSLEENLQFTFRPSRSRTGVPESAFMSFTSFPPLRERPLHFPASLSR